MIIGVTGPSGAGKSLFCSMLAERGFRVLDCDKIYHDIISSPCECTSALEARFGHGIINENGGVDRSALADIVFKDDEALTDLNSITLGYVKKEVKRMAYDAVSVGTPVVIDAPTLFEAGCEELCDITVGLLAPREKRAARLSSRDGGVRSENRSRHASTLQSRITFISAAATLCGATTETRMHSRHSPTDWRKKRRHTSRKEHNENSNKTNTDSRIDRSAVRRVRHSL